MSTQIAALCLASWTLGALYGGYKMERQTADRPLVAIATAALRRKGAVARRLSNSLRALGTISPTPDRVGLIGAVLLSLALGFVSGLM